MWRQCTLFVFLVLEWVMCGGFHSPALAQTYGVCEPYRLQGSFCAQVNIYQTLIAQAYAQQPAPSSPQYNAWMQHVGCLHSMQQIAAHYCSQSGGDGTFPMCTHEYSPGWNCQALAHYTNFLQQLNALPPTNDTGLINERDRLRMCLTFIVNNLQANCSGDQFNVPAFNPGNAGGGVPGGGNGYGNPGYPGGGQVGGGYNNPGGDPVNVPYSGKPTNPGFGQTEECDFLTDMIDIADHCVRARLFLEKMERLQSRNQLSTTCRQNLQQMYMEESRLCEQNGGNPSGQPRPTPLKPSPLSAPSHELPVDTRSTPCELPHLPDVADPCILARHVFEAWSHAQRMGAAPQCLHQLKVLFYEKQDACRRFSQEKKELPHMPEQPW